MTFLFFSALLFLVLLGVPAVTALVLLRKRHKP